MSGRVPSHQRSEGAVTEPLGDNNLATCYDGAPPNEIGGRVERGLVRRDYADPTSGGYRRVGHRLIHA